MTVIRPFELPDGRLVVQLITLGPGLCGGDAIHVDVTAEDGRARRRHDHRRDARDDHGSRRSTPSSTSSCAPDRTRRSSTTPPSRFPFPAARSRRPCG